MAVFGAARPGKGHGSRRGEGSIVAPPDEFRPQANAQPSPGHRETRRTVIIAGAANVIVGITKLAAGIISGSSSMLAEAAHSAADTLNQAFLLTSVHRGDRPADRSHPFGYGQERYFWSLLAAFGIFIAAPGSPYSRDCLP